MADSKEIYDVVIIGGGPGGLSAGLYAGRARLKTLILEKATAGGQAATTDIIENYPGFPQGINGYELTQKIREQAEFFGCEIREINPVTGIEADGNIRIINVEEGAFRSKTVIIAAGAEPRSLGVPGEDEFRGKGVSYCATCDGAFYRDKVVAVIGGGNAAVEEAIFLTKFVSKLYLIHRRAELRADKILQERALANSKIEVVWDSHLKKILGNGKVEEVVIENKKTHERTELKVDGVFFYIGSVPNTTFCEGAIELNDRDFIITNDHLMTSMPGVFACGDCRDNLLKQVVVATGEGALAAVQADKYIEDL